jgi:hypothetical protein
MRIGVERFGLDRPPAAVDDYIGQRPVDVAWSGLELVEQ